LYIDIYKALLGMSQTETISVYFSSRKKVRLKTREKQGKGSRENRGTKRRRFQREGPIDAKYLVWAIVVLIRG